MEYLMAEFDKIEMNLDRMLSTQQTGEAQMTSKRMKKEKLQQQKLEINRLKQMIRKEFKEKEGHLTL